VAQRLILCLLAAALLGAPVAGRAAPRVEFHVEAGDAAATLTEFSRQARLQLPMRSPTLLQATRRNRRRRKSPMISRAALCPGAPVTPPPGCVPAPHM
jgi:hypothetical protein